MHYAENREDLSLHLVIRKEFYPFGEGTLFFLSWEWFENARYGTSDVLWRLPAGFRSREGIWGGQGSAIPCSVRCRAALWILQIANIFCVGVHSPIINRLSYALYHQYVSCYEAARISVRNFRGKFYPWCVIDMVRKAPVWIDLDIDCSKSNEEMTDHDRHYRPVEATKIMRWRWTENWFQAHKASMNSWSAWKTRWGTFGSSTSFSVTYCCKNAEDKCQ